MPRINEAERLQDITQVERTYWERGILPCGMDEVGRGPLAGPVVVGCVILPPQPLIEFVKDSKQLSKKRREQVYQNIIELAQYTTAWVEPEIIDGINILNATKLAFKRAYEAMETAAPVALVDAVSGLDSVAEQRPIIHGDALCYLIGAASIVAKVERDAYMIKQHEQYPMYGFDCNKGYGTPQHIAALREYGPCPLHRRSFIGNFIGGKTL